MAPFGQEEEGDGGKEDVADDGSVHNIWAAEGRQDKNRQNEEKKQSHHDTAEVASWYGPDSSRPGAGKSELEEGGSADFQCYHVEEGRELHQILEAEASHEQTLDGGDAKNS
eukprot:CAMPEP_0194758220 /NCGR_PEP_ID=MMETSP0323_2-20130528/11549_1 /TAXON_ID=2866 ORGANISM="Crypthecodinium cohnii, Strain Seligo" /NCGR_SAMPLE_ID=MMETSP0323_2 /ASSEMBLY_ACC=CAM_ASM_000346 /LENGTH=111 /DNA_ID=CAMNT_0039678463 /DNA_START=106 /DNA_END=441 /DNA_ORIENTATION=-